MSGERRGKLERPEVKYVSHAWVENNCARLTERDIRLLRLIWQLRLCSRSQVQAISPDFTHLSQQCLILNNRLRVLFEKYCVDRIFPSVPLYSGTSQAHYALDKAGAILLELKNWHPIIKYKGGVRILPITARHTLFTNEIVKILTVLARENQVEILRLLRENENKRQFVSNGRQYTLIPDLFIILRHINKGALAFIEVDMATEDLNVMKKKVENYNAYLYSNTWKEEWKWSKNPVFPKVFIIINNERNVTRRIKALRQLAQKSSVKFIIGDINNIKQIFEAII